MVLLARRRDKRPAWVLAMALHTAAFLGVLGLGEGDAGAYAAIGFLSGLGMGGTIALPSSMRAAVIDSDQLRSGERREARCLALWSMARKLAAAGIALAWRYPIDRAVHERILADREPGRPWADPLGAG